jgi:hypothetical protein
MNNPPVERNLARWRRILKTRTRAAEPFTRKQAAGLSLIAGGAVSVVFIVVIWVFVELVAPKLKPSAESLAQSEEATQLTATALRSSLPGHDVRIERLFAFNLKLYVDRKPFEELPYPDRKAIMAKIGRSWCDNIGYHLLARVGVFDIRSGDNLLTHACVFGN